MDESTELQTPEEEVALRALAAKHRCRRRWIALLWSVSISVHTTVILHTIWDGWPLTARDLGLLVFLMVNAMGGLGLTAWGLRGLHRDEAMARQWTRQTARWQAQDRARRERWPDRTRPLGDGRA